MSLLGTLAKVAVGVAVAKGISTMAQGAKAGGVQPRGTTTGGGAGSGTVFGGDQSPSGRQTGGGSLQDILTGGGQGGGLGQLGEILSGRGSSQSGGLGGLLEGLSQASRPDGGTGAGLPPVTKPASGSLGDLLNQSLENFGEPKSKPTANQEEVAKLMLRATLQAAKSDGKIDEGEKKKLFGQLGDIDRDDMAFINQELAKPVDIEGLARDVPAGMGQQVYLMSLMGIDLDNQAEAQYLHKLASALSITPDQSNAIHARVGVPPIYR